MIDYLVNIFVTYSVTLPLEIIVFLFSILEEIIPPVPAFPVIILAGGLANIQNHEAFGIFLIIISAALGKTIGSVGVYYVVSNIGSVFTKKYGRYFDITTDDLATLGEKFGNGRKDFVILTILRAIPIIPSAIISVGCGLIRIPLRLYIIATFIGSCIRISFYIFAGYFGALTIIDYLEGSEKFSSLMQWLILIGFSVILIYLFNRTKKVGKKH